MSLSTNWRTINIDALDPDSPANFDLSSLAPSVAPTSAAEAQATAQQIRQLLRGGDSEGALRGALDTAPYGADERGKVRNFGLFGFLIVNSPKRSNWGGPLLSTVTVGATLTVRYKDAKWELAKKQILELRYGYPLRPFLGTFLLGLMAGWIFVPAQWD